jgi:nucleotide-binding universal stress UspA family protein
VKSPIRTVMVPLDGSPTAEEALAIGGALARAAGATLQLVTVMPPVSPVAGWSGGFSDGAGPERALREGLRAYLAEQAGAARAAATKTTAVTWEVLDGSPARALAAYAGAHDVDLVVMTTHGWGGLKRLWLGSVAEELLRQVRSAVLLLRPTGGRSAIGFHRVLVALDGTTGCEAVLESALAVAALFPGAHYTLTQVIEPPPGLVLRMLGNAARLGPAWVESERAAVLSRLEHLGRGLRRRGFVLDVRALVGQGTGEQILKLARTLQSDLLVIGTRGPSTVDRLAFGSVADKIVRGTTQPVLVVPLEAAPVGEARPDRQTATLAHGGQAP